MTFRMSFLFGAIAALTMSCAQAADPYVEGVNYFRVSTPGQVTPSTDSRIEVVEVFSHGCIHCFHFQPVIDAWLKTPEAAKARLVYLPAGFNQAFAVFARAYLVAEEMGVAEKTHQGVYDQLWKENATVQTIDGLAELYAKLGVDKTQFMRLYNSAEIDVKFRQAFQFLQRYDIDGTPSVVVAGKYRITGDSAGAPEKVFDVVNFLVARESQAKSAR